MTIERRTSVLGKHLKTHIILPPQEIQLSETWSTRKTLKVLSPNHVYLIEEDHLREQPTREPLVKEEINVRKIRSGLIFQHEYRWIA